MRCSPCGICCEETEMLLANADIERFEGLGYSRRKFVRYDRRGAAQLKNRRGFCVFFNVEKCRCRIHKHRPLGCRIYPVMCSWQEGIVMDDLCPVRHTVAKIELRRKGRRLIALLQRIDNEAHMRIFGRC